MFGLSRQIYKLSRTVVTKQCRKNYQVPDDYASKSEWQYFHLTAKMTEKTTIQLDRIIKNQEQLIKQNNEINKSLEKILSSNIENKIIQ